MATLIVSWMSVPQAEPIFRYVGAMNLFVHRYHQIMTTKHFFNASKLLSLQYNVLLLWVQGIYLED